jgi:hypothetical protein
VDVKSDACVTGEHTVHISKYANQKHTFFEAVKFTGQLLARENPKRYSSYYLKNLFCEALENRPTLFTQIWPR